LLSHPSHFPACFVRFDSVRLLILFCGSMLSLAPGKSWGADPSSCQNLFEFAGSLYIRELYDSAAEKYKEFVADCPGGATEEDARFFWAECYYYLQDYPEAGRLFELLMEKFPLGAKRKDSLLRLGEVYYRQQQYEIAEKKLRDLLIEKPDSELSEVARFYLGSSYLESDKIPQAQGVFQVQLKEAPQGQFAPFAKFGLARALVSVDAYEEAIQLWQQVVQESREAEDEPRFKQLVIKSLKELGETYYQLGRYSEAAQIFSSIAQNYPDASQVGQALYREIWSLFQGGEYSPAFEKAKSLLQRSDLENLDSIRVGTHAMLGMICFEQKQYSKARKQYETVYQLPRQLPQWEQYGPEARYRITLAYYMEEMDSEARREAERFLREFSEHPLSGHALFVKAEALYRQKLYQSARFDFSQLATQYPDHPSVPQARFRIGYCDFLMEDYQQSALRFADFIRDYPESDFLPEAFFMLGESYFQGTLYQEAVQAYPRFIRTYSEHEQIEPALYRWGLSFLQLEDYAHAAEVFQELLKRFPISSYRSTACFWIAYHADESGEVETAVQNYSSVLQLQDEKGLTDQAKRRLAMLYYNQNQQQKAADLFFDLILEPETSPPLEPAFYVWTGDQFFQLASYEKASKVYLTLIERFPLHDYVERILYQIAQSYFHLQDWDQSASYYERIKKEFPQGAYTDLAALGRAQINIKQNQYEATTLRLKSIMNSSDLYVAAQARLLSGEAFEQLRQLEEAQDCYLQVAFLFDHPQLVPQAYWKASRIMLKRGRREEALRTLQELQRFYPNSEYHARAQSFLENPLTSEPWEEGLKTLGPSPSPVSQEKP